MLVKTQTLYKEAANLAACSLSFDTYITNIEKQSKLRKTGIFFQRLILNLLSKTIEKQLWKS